MKIIEFTAVVPNDFEDLPKFSTTLFVGTGGDLKVTTIKGDTVTLANVENGAVLSIQASRVWATGTTASNIKTIEYKRK